MEYKFSRSIETIPDGGYECILMKITPKVEGNEVVSWSFRWKIREDIETNPKQLLGKSIFTNVRMGINYTPNSEKKLNEIINTQNYEGNSIVFQSDDDLLAYLTGICCYIELKTRPWKEKPFQFQSFHKSRYQPSQLSAITEIVEEDIDDEDLPF